MTAQDRWPKPLAAVLSAVRVGTAAHDHRFLRPLLPAWQAAGCVVRDDPWQGHRRHRAAWSRAIGSWSDVVFAEWCLGNAVWHAAHLDEHTRLIVRFHRFELETPFPGELDATRAEAIVFVAPHIRDEAVARFGLPADRCVVIPNAVDAAALARPKTSEAPYTLGLLTWHRQLKRLDLALDLLESLRRHEPRARLRVKGRHPQTVGFVWKQDDERAYFARQMERIEQSDLLRDAVTFDDHGDDVASWFTGIGHVLSLSDVESFHLALVEGMASGAAPVIRDRWGVDALFGDRWVVEDVDQAANVIGQRIADGSWRSEGQRAAAMVREHYDRPLVDPTWVRLVTGRPSPVL